MEYLGSIGRLVPLRCASAERVQAAARYVPSVTVEGRRRVQVVPASPRAWDVSWGVARPGEVAALAAFASGAWGVGPFHWVPIQAHRGNLLTPREADLMQVASGPSWALSGPVLDAAGAWQGRSLAVSMSSSWGALFANIPVVPGKPVTWAADVRGSSSGALAMAFADSEGAVIGGGRYGAATPSSTMTRLSMTEVAPPGAASVRVGVRPAVTTLTRPQVTWTDGPVPYSAGHGCRSAVVDGFSEDLLVANSFGTYSSIGFTVMEVG